MKAYGRHLNPGMKKMSTSVRLSAPADPGPNANPRKAIHWSRGKKATFASGGVAGAPRLPFPFGALLNRALMSISSLIGTRGREEKAAPPPSLSPRLRGGRMEERRDACTSRRGRKPGELERTLSNTGLL